VRVDMFEATPKQIIEALLMVSEEPLSIERLYKIFCAGDNLLEINAIKNIINELVNEYSDGGIELKEVASGWRFQIKSDLSFWVSKLYEERPPRYSRALLEILALIAYRQPITRAEIEDVRGVVVSSNIVKTLLEHEWIRVVGYKEVPGKPALFATTKKFLDHFNLKHLDELPPLTELTEKLVLENSLDSGAENLVVEGGDTEEGISIELEDNAENINDEDNSQDDEININVTFDSDGDAREII
jgi:segregation and condensation protein B